MKTTPSPAVLPGPEPPAMTRAQHATTGIARPVLELLEYPKIVGWLAIGEGVSIKEIVGCEPMPFR